jgi:hypothetical protein
MRTTVTIDDELLARAKQRARAAGKTLGQVVDAALRRELATPSPTGEPPKIPVFTGGSGPRPGIDLQSNRSIHEVLDDGRDLDQRR